MILKIGDVKMTYVLIKIRVDDFDKWKTILDGHKSVRASMGSPVSRVFRNPDDSNDVTILMEWDNLDNAQSSLIRMK